jgi:hypothetical protein
MKITSKDTHTLIEIELQDSKEIFTNEVSNLETENTFYIIDAKSSFYLKANLIKPISDWNKKLMSDKGYLVCVAFDDEISDQLQKDGIISVPTLKEAEDFIIMEQIERQLLEDDI